MNTHDISHLKIMRGLAQRLRPAALALICLMLWPALAARPSNRVEKGLSAVRGSSGIAAAGKYNGKIAFSGSHDNRLSYILYVMNPDGSSQMKLNGNDSDSSEFTYDTHPSWSPDGTKLAFSKYIQGEGSSIFTMNADGSNLKRLTKNVISDYDPAWSPDGTKIAFTRGSGCVSVLEPKRKIRTAADNPCQPYIWVINADGSNEMELSFEGGEGEPAWSPDGSKIAFNKYVNDGPGGWQIFVMNADGSNRVRLPTNNNRTDFLYDAVGSWSPDGSKLVYYSNRDIDLPDFYRFQIYVMNADGTNQRRLTNNNLDDSLPVFSPDGTKIAFQRADPLPDYLYGPNYEIYVMNADGSEQTNITNNRGTDWGPVGWQPLSSPLTVTPPAVLQFEKGSYQVSEGAGSVDITITRSGNTDEAVTAQYETTNGTATSPADYTLRGGTLRFAPGEVSKTIPVLITGDLFVEDTETFKLSFYNLGGNVALGTQREATVSILDDDTAQPTTNPLDDPQFFVRQQYHDFLNREPDPGGLAYWTNEITRCGGDLQCVRSQRVNVSAAFFMSQEFADTGFFVFRLYRTATGRSPDYGQYIRERNRLIGGPDLETQKRLLVEDSMSLFYGPLTNEQFVELIFSNSDLYGLSTERQQELSALNNGQKTRPQVLRDVIELQASRMQDYNSVFVYMQYYGYLSRTPDTQGFDFWLNILDHQVPNNYRAMVCAFITSTEYQKRFSPIVTHSNAECAP